MSYCTQSDIQKLIPTQELAELTAETGSTPDATVITEAIAKADAEIDSYCTNHYTVPFQSIPAIIKTISEDISLYNLYSRRSVVPELRKDRYESAVKFLTAVATGEFQIAGATPKTAPAQAVDIDSLTQAIQRLKDSGYDITAANVSSLLGISVSESSQPIATATITLEQASQAIAKLKQAGYILNSTEVRTLLGLTVTDATTPQAPPDLRALSETLLNLKKIGVVVSDSDIEVLFGITLEQPRSVSQSPQLASATSIFNRDNMTSW